MEIRQIVYKVKGDEKIGFFIKTAQGFRKVDISDFFFSIDEEDIVDDSMVEVNKLTGRIEIN